MLKIKDSVDLKDIHNNKFKYYPLIYQKEYTRESEFEELNTCKCIYVEEQTRLIGISPNKGYMQFNTDIELDALYDLIQDGLVEKVEE